MDKTSSEIFGNFLYDESLTYDELLHTEETLTYAIEDLLKRAGAEHVDFTPMGDSLMLQCCCQGHKIYIFRKLACELAEILPPKISGRICCLSHALNTCHVYWLRKNTWQEASLAIPLTPLKGAKEWKAEENEKETEALTDEENPLPR
ncbi:MAG: hypothetical protein K6G15_03895 [Desulfovibrio sp.]|nr:hypothetical protein [Desulfovibrio sp.]